jgi:hypothetical protein
VLEGVVAQRAEAIFQSMGWAFPSPAFWLATEPSFPTGVRRMPLTAAY